MTVKAIGCAVVYRLIDSEKCATKRRSLGIFSQRGVAVNLDVNVVHVEFIWLLIHKHRRIRVIIRSFHIQVFKRNRTQFFRIILIESALIFCKTACPALGESKYEFRILYNRVAGKRAE